MKWFCVGCNKAMSWDGKGIFCYTCPCGSHIFYSEDGSVSLPVSALLTIGRKSELPHLDYLVGTSDFTSPVKESMIVALRAKGAIWMRECQKCLQDGTYQSVLDREKAKAVLEAERILISGARD